MRSLWRTFSTCCVRTRANIFREPLKRSQDCERGTQEERESALRAVFSDANHCGREQARRIFLKRLVINSLAAAPEGGYWEVRAPRTSRRPRSLFYRPVSAERRFSSSASAINFFRRAAV